MQFVLELVGETFRSGWDRRRSSSILQPFLTVHVSPCPTSFGSLVPFDWYLFNVHWDTGAHM